MKVALQGTGRMKALARTLVVSESLQTPNHASWATVTPSGRVSSISLEEYPFVKGEGRVLKEREKNMTIHPIAWTIWTVH